MAVQRNTQGLQADSYAIQLSDRNVRDCLLSAQSGMDEDETDFNTREKMK